MTVLDTGFLIDVMRGNEGATAALPGLMEGYSPVAISAITVMELHHGIPRSTFPRKETSRIARALAAVTTYPITHELAAKAGEIDGALVDEGRAIGVHDALIAATALAYDEPVLTRNRKHFGRVAGLHVLTY